MIPSIFGYWSGFCNFHFLNSSVSIERGSAVHVGLGLGVGKILIAGLGLDSRSRYSNGCGNGCWLRCEYIF